MKHGRSSAGPGHPISCLRNAGKSLVIELHAKLPYKRQLVKTISSRRNYVNVYFGLTPKLAKKLSSLAKAQKKAESEVLRGILDAYLKNIDNKGLSYEPLRKLSPIGLKTLPRTIRKDQDRKLREIAEKTGRKISELVREAVRYPLL